MPSLSLVFVFYFRLICVTLFLSISPDFNFTDCVSAAHKLYSCHFSYVSTSTNIGKLIPCASCHVSIFERIVKYQNKKLGDSQ